MRLRRSALAMLPVIVAALLSSGELIGQGFSYAPPLPVYHSHHRPLPYLTFKPLHHFHLGHAYYPYAFGYAPFYPQASFFFGYPIVRERIIIVKRPPALEAHKHWRFPSIDFWLLALKHGPIYAVADYWLEDETLHYIERDSTKSSVPLKDVDLGFTKRLNRRLGTPFRLPQPPSCGTHSSCKEFKPARGDRKRRQDYSTPPAKARFPPRTQ